MERISRTEQRCTGSHVQKPVVVSLIHQIWHKPLGCFRLADSLARDHAPLTSQLCWWGKGWWQRQRGSKTGETREAFPQTALPTGYVCGGGRDGGWRCGFSKAGSGVWVSTGGARGRGGGGGGGGACDFTAKLTVTCECLQWYGFVPEDFSRQPQCTRSPGQSVVYTFWLQPCFRRGWLAVRFVVLVMSGDSQKTRCSWL